MPRASRTQQATHHGAILEQASRLLREHGPDAVTVPGVMAAVGLTHGGFYKHFGSKDDLLAEAGSTAFAARARVLAGLRDDDPASARERFVASYLSGGHRDHPGNGCPTAALAADVGRRAPTDRLRAVYLDGLREMVATMTDVDDGDEQAALTDVATLVGAVMLARAAAGDPLSERFLAAARDQLLDGDPGPTS